MAQDNTGGKRFYYCTYSQWNGAAISILDGCFITASPEEAEKAIREVATRNGGNFPHAIRVRDITDAVRTSKVLGDG